jgi:2-polyprenyl-6-methoxyphenol hydroxylase-like FAD-dependent oxidoreductase
MKIIIAGGGIAGLTTGISLCQKGFHVEVFESAAEIKPLGVGINLLPHAVRVLTELGLEERVGLL